MHINEFLEKVCDEIKYKPIQKDISEELKNHIEEIKQEQFENGIEEKEAEKVAVKQMGEPIEIGKRLNKIHRPKLDWQLLIIVLILLAFGIVVSFIKTQSVFKEGYQINYFIKNTIFLAIGILLGLGIYFFDYTKISKYSNYIYIFSTIVAILGLTTSMKVNGRAFLYITNWLTISIESITMPLYIIAFAGFINNYDKNNNFKFSDIVINKDLAKILILGVISIVFMTCIPSLASSVILLSIYIVLGTIGIINKSKNKKKYLTIMYLIITICGILFIYNIFATHPYRIERFTSFINPEEYINTTGWIPLQQRLILNSAKPIGEAENLSNMLNIFDEGSDYAHISIIAHYGVIPAGILIITVLIFSTKILYNSKIIKDNYGKLLIIGIGGYFILESVINILMNLTLGMQIASKIPFVSYGGTSMIFDSACIALVLAIYRRKNIQFYKNKN